MCSLALRGLTAAVARFPARAGCWHRHRPSRQPAQSSLCKKSFSKPAVTHPYTAYTPLAPSELGVIAQSLGFEAKEDAALYTLLCHVPCKTHRTRTLQHRQHVKTLNSSSRRLFFQLSDCGVATQAGKEVLHRLLPPLALQACELCWKHW